MSRWSARGFSWVQHSPLYRELHEAAVALLPTGHGRRWLDVGCGPGLVSRLAAARGYGVQGVDLDPHMVAAARRASPAGPGAPTFSVGSVHHLPPMGADVVSAASLLAVLSDREQALRALRQAVASQGRLLLIEPSETMTWRAAWAYLRRHRRWDGAWALLLWAATRRPERAVPRSLLVQPGWRLSVQPLWDGMVNAWVMSRAPDSPAPGSEGAP